MAEALAELIKRHIRPSLILTQKSFENVIMVHAAIAGSSNALLHLPTISHELGIEMEADLFNRIHRNIPYIASIMEEIKDYLLFNVMTVTGKTLERELK